MLSTRRKLARLRTAASSTVPVAIETQSGVQQNGKYFMYYRRLRRRLRQRSTETIKEEPSTTLASNMDIFAEFADFRQTLGPLIGWIISPILIPVLLTFLGGYYMDKFFNNNWVYVFLPLLIALCIAIRALIISSQNIHEVQSKQDWLNRYEFNKLRSKLPFEFSEPEIESTRWINEILRCL